MKIPIAARAMAIHLYDGRARRISAIPGSQGLWTPRWSPDGAYIAALRANGTSLLLSRSLSSKWKTILKAQSLDDLMWSPDSKHVFLMGALDSARLQLVRVSVPDGLITRIADVHDFPRTTEQWFGLAPDGSALGLRGIRSQEIYALECKPL